MSEFGFGFCIGYLVRHVLAMVQDFCRERRDYYRRRLQELEAEPRGE